MILDYCVGYPAKKAEVARAMQLTTLWAERSRKYADKIKFKIKFLASFKEEFLKI